MDNEMMELMTKMYAEMLEIKGEVQSTNKRLDVLEKEVAKNTISLENLEDKVKTIAECQVAFAEQLERNNDATNKHINDRMDVMEMAITSNAKNKGGNILRIISNGNIDIEMPNNNTI